MKKVLVANRGEIAVRVARACRDHGVLSVAVYADADFDALHVRTADEAFALQGDSPANTYLHIGKLLDVARRSGADAVHPGYGFLSENAAFAQAVIDAGLTWIGPAPHVIAQLGDKVLARRLAARVGAPLVAGSDGPVNSAAEAVAFASRHGVPIAVKAAFGGGGRGLKVAWSLEDVESAFDSAVREAVAAFGRGECYVEQYLDRPRHVEAQLLSDAHGNIVVLGTRDCSLQRRHQKLVEEAPAPFLTDALRARIHAAARDICQEAGYVGAGTVEFLLGNEGALSFLEVNTRLQVEHPVTEEVFGVDIVREQLRVADGQPLSFSEAPEPRGHAIEFRINAEDVARGFLPHAGRVSRFEPPGGPGVRLDTGVQAGSLVPDAFDSLMAKLVVTGRTREEALARARRALAEFRIDGVASVLPFHRAVVRHPDFTAEQGMRVHTRWIETDFDLSGIEAHARPQPPEPTVLQRLAVEVDGRRVSLGLPPSLLALATLGAAAQEGATAPSAAGPSTSDAPTGHGELLRSPVSGSLQAWLVAEGEAVVEGQSVGVLEAMKMEMQLTAPCAGLVRLLAQAGSSVQAGEVLAHVVRHPPVVTLNAGAEPTSE